MAFIIKDIPPFHFQNLNDFFSNGFESKDLIEHHQQINLPFGDLHTHEWYFNGIRMAYSDWHLRKPVELKWSYDIKVELVSFMASLGGATVLGHSSMGMYPLLGNYQHNLFYSGANHSSEGVLKCEGNRASLFFIQFTKDAFYTLTKDANAALNQFNESVFAGRDARLSDTNLAVKVPQSNIIANVVDCIYGHDLKKMYLLSKSIELLVMQAESCTDALKPVTFIKSTYDKECILYAREYMLKNLEAPPSLSELAKIVGINEYKLKRGFKEIVGDTVFGFLADTRLEIAKNELLENKTSIGELAARLGYSSMQHFSSAFRKKFGVSPNKFK